MIIIENSFTKFTKLLVIAFILLLLATCKQDYDDYDADLDNRVDEEEFYDHFNDNNYFDGWDTNNDEELSEIELYNGMFKALDENEDQKLSEDEWTTTEYFLTGYVDDDYGTFTDWDKNDDSFMDKKESAEALANSQMFEKWDKNADKSLHKNELETRLNDSI